MDYLSVLNVFPPFTMFAPTPPAGDVPFGGAIFIGFGIGI